MLCTARIFAEFYNRIIRLYDFFSESRNGGEKALRVVRLRVVEDLIGFAFLGDFARAHDGDAVGYVPNDAEIVRDEEVTQTEALLLFFPGSP